MTDDPKKITKLITSEPKSLIMGVVLALMMCEEHEHEFMVAKDGVAVAQDDVDCLTARGVRL